MSAITKNDLDWCVDVIRRAANNRAGIMELKAVALQVEDATDELARLRAIEAAARGLAPAAYRAEGQVHIRAAEFDALAAALQEQP
jgi:hypothetical protein